MEESQAIVRFVAGWAEDGVSDDGLPRYRATVRVIKSVPPLTEIQRVASEQDIEENPGPYALFEKEQSARLLAPAPSGFPLALWPVVSPAQFQTLVARDIVTVEQLAKYAGRRDGSVPGEFLELADRAKQMIALSSSVGKFEAMIRDLEGRIAALDEQAKEMGATISAQNALIATLKQQKAA